ncbi:AAA family ATPase [Anaerotignum sp.]|uniref:AAA family ATPase n=1 Tax=Anaerotignum sp. TaxID=2039241 RepID=UPI00289B36E4|nr:AAA family ATPase [Anaerotignum sp.]
MTNLIEILDYIEPAMLEYTDWLMVGMALKEGGYTVEVWEQWSSRDMNRYRLGECQKKWNGFHGNNKPVTIGTIVQMAKDQGWSPEKNSYEIEWDGEIGGKDDLVIINKNWIENQEVEEPEDAWNPAQQLITYLETIFEASENVGYVTQSWEKDGRYLPSAGNYDRTAGQLVEALSNCNGDIGSVLGDYKTEAGAWIRFNPLDGKGVKNDNVTEFRYALVESDTMEIERQNAIIRELELPVACLVHSGGKSLHAIVKIEAGSYDEYRKRVDYLYDVCQKNGLKIDSQNRNPSRLSRMPGVLRNGKKQFLVAKDIGKESWNAWKEWIESMNDELPEPESMADAWDKLPDLAEPLIEGILRKGHKMLIAGPSKAGKSFSLIELCCAMAEGREWCSWKCTQGRVMYVNLELDRASCLHRFKDVYTALGWEPNHLANIDIWNLRGKSVPMDKLAPKLIRRAAKKDYVAIIIDPIYKVITGDENSADQMAHFCNQFDKVCTELGCAVIYCHHHSKGSQGNKRSMDRASGSGVFARDPDALLDLIELDLTDAIKKQEENKAVCAVCDKWLKNHAPEYEDEVSQDDKCSQVRMQDIAKRLLTQQEQEGLQRDIERTKKAVATVTAWRIEGTLREFPKFAPVNLWFDYPIHKFDTIGILNDIQPGAEQPPWKKNFEKKKSPEESKKERKESLETQFESLKSFSTEGKVTVQGLAESMGTTEKTVRNRIKEHGGFWIDEGYVGKK